MKLATYHDGSRDGQLVVVSRDLATAHFATAIATRLQQVLDDWNFLSPQLEDLYVTLNQGKARHAFPFEPAQCMAPLPRAYQWVEGAAYPTHAERLGMAPGDGPQGDVPLTQAASDDLLGATDDPVFSGDDAGIDFGAGLAVVCADVERGCTPEAALEGIRLLLLANSWRLHEPAGGGSPAPVATAFGPVAVTPDELGPAWTGGRVHLTLQTSVQGRRLGLCETGPDMAVHFGQLIAQLARHRRVRAGSIIGSGIVSNADTARGFACIAEKRAAEAAEHGAARSPWLQVGDRVRIELKGHDGHSVFGTIEQQVVAPGGPPADDAPAAGQPG